MNAKRKWYRPFLALVLLLSGSTNLWGQKKISHQGKEDGIAQRKFSSETTPSTTPTAILSRDHTYILDTARWSSGRHYIAGTD